MHGEGEQNYALVHVYFDCVEFVLGGYDVVGMLGFCKTNP